MNNNSFMSVFGGKILKFLLAGVLTLSTLTSSAQINDSGYYRVQNFKTQRYAYLRDNRSWIIAGTADIELGALELWAGFENAACDPATVMYFENHGSSGWDIQAQGTGVYSFINLYVKLRDNGDNTYLIYATKSGLTKYLGDARNNSTDQGVMSSNVSGDGRKWYITPITAAGDNYLGVKPTVSVGGKHYRAFYADFPFSTYSTGMKVYYIKTVANGMAVLSEINGVVPKSTPVLIECSNTEPANNRLEVGGSGSAVGGNLLSGVYFNNANSQHLNRTAFNASSMRVLGITADGSLGYITPSLDFLPANESYLQVPAGTPAELKIVTQEEYDKIMASQPSGISLNVSSLDMQVGDVFQFVATVTPSTATGYTISYSSSDNNVAWVDADANVHAQAEGTAVITASIGNIKTTCTVTVKDDKTPKGLSLNVANLELMQNDSYRLIASVTPETATGYTIEWLSSAPDIAAVDNQGNVTAKAVGQAVVTARIGTNLSASCTVTVTPLVIALESITLSSSSVSLIENNSVTLSATPVPANATDYAPVWASSDPSVATVTNGVVKAIAPGQAVITVSSGNIKSECNVTVTPVPQVLPEKISLDNTQVELIKGATIQLNAIVTPDNADNKTLTWSTDDAAVASVDNTGFVSALGGGTATITVSTVNGLTASCVVNVKVLVESVAFDSKYLTAYEGDVIQLIPTILPVDATNKNLSWKSSNPTVAVVDNQGFVTILSAGSADVTATTLDGTNITATCRFNTSSGIQDILADNPYVDVYSLQGHLLRHNADAAYIATLQPGVYIISTGTARIKVYLPE